MSEFELNSDDILVFGGERVIADQSPILGRSFMQNFNRAIGNYGGSEEARNKFLKEGLWCKVLKPGQQWQTGKLRVRLEFVPDEPESPLDEYRQNPPVE